uniref:Uncharacterized protein n=1 Tax=Prevotella sp. GTC17262 TaxID=3236797 RepID=A0AB33JJ45_9BACT
MKKYIVTYSETESGLTNFLESISTIANPIYEKEFATFEEANEFAKHEAEMTSLTKIEELDFSPSEHEMRTNVCYLYIFCVDVDDEENADLLNHENDGPFWINY